MNDTILRQRLGTRRTREVSHLASDQTEVDSIDIRHDEYTLTHKIFTPPIEAQPMRVAFTDLSIHLDGKNVSIDSVNRVQTGRRYIRFEMPDHAYATIFITPELLHELRDAIVEYCDADA